MKNIIKRIQKLKNLVKQLKIANRAKKGGKQYDPSRPINSLSAAYLGLGVFRERIKNTVYNSFNTIVFSGYAYHTNNANLMKKYTLNYKVYNSATNAKLIDVNVPWKGWKKNNPANNPNAYIEFDRNLADGTLQIFTHINEAFGASYRLVITTLTPGTYAGISTTLDIPQSGDQTLQ
jgi:hypothetical protein